MTISPRPEAEQTPPREALFDATPRICPPDRHWFVNDSAYPGYCSACGLPRANRRHAAKAA